jgi:hypothetical protein
MENDEELENANDKARDEEVNRKLSLMREQYKSLFNEYPDENILIAEIQEKIRSRLPRPFRL